MRSGVNAAGGRYVRKMPVLVNSPDIIRILLISDPKLAVS